MVTNQAVPSEPPLGRCVSGKTAYPTQVDIAPAVAALRALNKARGVRKPVRAYQCPWCSWWHITSSRKYPRTLVRRQQRRRGGWA